MKNLALTIMIGCGLGFATVSATARDFAQERGAQSDYRMAMTWPWSKGLKEEINHLNRMRGHVRWQLRNYRSSKGIRHDFFQLSRDIDQINSRFQSGSYKGKQLRHDVERAHAEIHRIELALKV